MTHFLELSRLDRTAIQSKTYDIAFVGTPTDDRGRKSIDVTNSASKESLATSYDAQNFLLIVNGEKFPATQRGFAALVNKFHTQRILLDATTLDFPELLLITKAFVSFRDTEIGYVYVEPESYEERGGSCVEDLHAFSLRDGFQPFAPIPGFTPMLSDTRKARLLAFVGFESTRLKRVLVEDEGARIKEFSVVFGVPPFQASWEMHSFMQNANILKEPAMEEVQFVGANNPRSAYKLAQKVAETCCPKTEVMTVAPLGTKPMAIGVALFAAQQPGIRVVFDYPRTRPNCTRGVGKIHHYAISIPANKNPTNPGPKI